MATMSFAERAAAGADAGPPRDQHDPGGAAAGAAAFLQIHLVQPAAGHVPRGRRHGAAVP